MKHKLLCWCKLERPFVQMFVYRNGTADFHKLSPIVLHLLRAYIEERSQAHAAVHLLPLLTVRPTTPHILEDLTLLHRKDIVLPAVWKRLLHNKAWGKNNVCSLNYTDAHKHRAPCEAQRGWHTVLPGVTSSPRLSSLTQQHCIRDVVLVKLHTEWFHHHRPEENMHCEDVHERWVCCARIQIRLHIKSEPCVTLMLPTLYNNGSIEQTLHLFSFLSFCTSSNFT